MFRSVHCQRTQVSKMVQKRWLAASSGETSSSAVKISTTISSPKSRPLPRTTSGLQQKMRDDFFRREAEWEAMVDLEKLTEDEKVIHNCHKEAVKGLHLTYEDPFTGLKVMTRWRHWSKGACCGKACRHCVWNHEKVPDERAAQRIYNSAFWIDRPGIKIDEE